MSSKASLSAMAQVAKKRKASKPAASTQPTKKPSLAQLSAEFVQDSDDDPASEKDSESENESISTDPVEFSSKASGKLPRPDGSSSESEDESDEDGSSDNDEVEERITSSKEKPVAVEPLKKPAAEAPIRVASSQRPPAYKPPTGFELDSLDGSSMASQMFKNSNLVGKQTWYFTAPASVPVSSITQMSLLDVKEGKSILKHEGDEYGFKEEATNGQTSTKIMVPNSTSEGYRTSSSPIDRILHLQQIIDLPGIKKLKSNPSTAYQKVPRPQPKGLRMRFHPIGFDTEKPENIGSSSSSEENDSDVEMEDAPKAFKHYEIPGSEITSTDSSSEDSDSSSDEGANTAPILPTKLTSKSKPATPSGKQSSTQDAQQSLKRKASDGKIKKSKNSLSSPAIDTEDRKLKRVKPNPTKSRENTANTALASTKLSRSQNSTVVGSDIKKPESSSKSHGSNHPLKPLESSQSSLPSETDPDFIGSPKVPSSKKVQNATTILPPLKAKHLSSKDLAKARDPAPDDWRKETKKLKKHKGQHRHSSQATIGT